MPDIFLEQDARKLMHNKTVVFLGDSNIRALYKDLVVLLQSSSFINEKLLRCKMEPSFCNDRLVACGRKSNGRDYKEERIYSSRNVKLYFYFLTRIYSPYMKDILKKLTDHPPDVLVMNSCLWDISRWGPHGVDEYQENLVTLMKHLKDILPSKSLVIWTTTLPLSQDMRGGFLIPQLDFLKFSLRFHVMEANLFARRMVVRYGFDVLDFHYNMKLQLCLRSKDGIHWMPPAVRHMTNLLLTHISLAWGVPLPHRYSPGLTNREDETETKLTEQAEPPSKRLKTDQSAESSETRRCVSSNSQHLPDGKVVIQNNQEKLQQLRVTVVSDATAETSGFSGLENYTVCVQDKERSFKVTASIPKSVNGQCKEPNIPQDGTSVSPANSCKENARPNISHQTLRSYKIPKRVGSFTPKDYRHQNRKGRRPQPYPPWQQSAQQSQWQSPQAYSSVQENVTYNVCFNSQPQPLPQNPQYNPYQYNESYFSQPNFAFTSFSNNQYGYGYGVGM